MKNLRKWMQDASKGGFALWKLNFILSIGIPFNRPHRIKILKLTANEAQCVVPYKRINHNHIRGTHACALATVAEYSTGLVLLNRLDPGKFRLIMKELNMIYHYQAKSDVISVFHLLEEHFQNNLAMPISQNEAILFTARAELHDVNGNHIATGTSTWQVKSWEKVKTKL